MKEQTYVSGSNYFNQNSLDQMKELLEKGKAIQVGIACIGHTRNNSEQEAYKEALTNLYGDRLEVKYNDGVCSYSYSYQLKETK